MMNLELEIILKSKKKTEIWWNLKNILELEYDTKDWREKILSILFWIRFGILVCEFWDNTGLNRLID